MEEQFYTAVVDESVADLIPEYLNNRRKEIKLLQGFLAAGELQRIADIAHRMIGVGTPYGFHHVTNLAKIIRETALGNDADTLRELLKEYEHYIAHVTVKIRKG
ncbi:MAG TPA: hypothetical protein VG873_00930 [Burkholderiales bacterium]|nr:hypothetical protein [Burkholderiales bacterium]